MSGFQVTYTLYLSTEKLALVLETLTRALPNRKMHFEVYSNPGNNAAEIEIDRDALTVLSFDPATRTDPDLMDAWTEASRS